MFNFKTFAAFALVLILAATAYAFATSNTVAPSGAGEGSAPISGYNVTAVKYTLQRGAGPTQITAVSFNVVPLGGQGDPTNVEAKLYAGDTWHVCTKGAGQNWSCSIDPPVNVTTAETLTVLAWQE